MAILISINRLDNSTIDIDHVGTDTMILETI